VVKQNHLKLEQIVRSFCVILVIGLFDPSLFGAEPKLLPRELLDEGWIQLFDGETLFGWKPVGDAEWEVASSEIRTDGAQPGFLMTTTEWADYELVLEFRAAATTNSGVFLRTPLEPKDPATDCYELNIAPADNPFPTGSIVKRVKASTSESPAPNPSPQGGGEPEWHTFKVTAWNGWIEVELDGERVTDASDPQPIRIGHIGLQSNKGPIAFRNIRLRPIELMPKLSTGDLSNFVTDRAEQSKFEVVPEGDKNYVLHLTNGPGQIETKEQFANFVLQLECKVNGKGLNSGVFYRTLPEGRWAGYESQINNVFKDGDRTKPADFGTGGIYRRQPARRVVADDGKWFSKTIVADGPHVAVWVDGYQVSDWTDDRAPKQNAREGSKLDAGVIAIQGHDPTTDFLFRDFQVAELPRGERAEDKGQRLGN
jgi:hypothetical protein